MRLVHSFTRFLSTYPNYPADLLVDASATDPEQRIPATLAHRFLSDAVERTNDPALGLKAGCAVSLGDGGALDYAMSSAATVREALAVAARFVPLVNDALTLQLDSAEGRAFFRMDSRVVMPPAAEDFLVSAVYKNHMRVLANEAADLECWFLHAKPSDTAEYERMFVPAALRFGSPACGFAFRHDFLDTPLAKADPKLHDVLKKHAEMLLSEIPTASSVTDTVRNRLIRELPQGNANATHVAQQLHMSQRTLERKLASEGTTFKQLLDEMRRRLALEYVSTRNFGLSEIAFLLGFSQQAAFHRAFKRWTSQTPLEYRRARQR